MKLETRWVDIGVGAEAFAALRARPASAQEPLPGVIVIQEAWGVDEHIQDVTARIATAGYLALAPDLHSVGGRPPELAAERVAAVKSFLETVPPAVWTDAEARERAVAALPDEERELVGDTMVHLFSRRDPEVHLAALRATVDALSSDEACDGLIGSIGWCMGGGLSARLAAREPRLRAAVIFYGSPPPDDEILAIACPLLGFYGADDARITGAIPAFERALRQAGVAFEHHVYPEAPHAFFNDTRRSYRVDAARDAWARCLMFFRSHLSTIAV